VEDPQHVCVNCPGHIRGLTVADIWRKDAAVQASAPGIASPWDCEDDTLFWFWLPPATEVPRSRPSPRWGAEENGKKKAETGGSG